MTNRQLARIHAALRIRLRLRQEDVARAAGIGRWKVVKIEAGEIDGLTLDDLRDSFEALGARLEVVVTYRGANLDRLLDERHAQVVGAVVRILQELGWMVRVEVSYSIRGERGSIDVLAWHPAERAMLIVEVKSELPGVDPLLRPLDAKVRLAPGIARDQFGWQPATVSRLVVLAADRTARRQVDRHSDVLTAALPARSIEVRRWLKKPSGVLAGLWFLSVDGHTDAARNPSAIRRVQRPKVPAPERGRRDENPDLSLIDPHKVGVADN